MQKVNAAIIRFILLKIGYFFPGGKSPCRDAMITAMVTKSPRYWPEVVPNPYLIPIRFD